MERLEDIKCTRFDIDGTEYLRINGVWFQYSRDKYIPLDKPDFEKYYKEHFEND